MNDLSWMLYLIGVIPGFKTLLIAASIVSVTAIVAFTIGYFINKSEANQRYNQDKREYLQANVDMCGRFIARFSCGLIIAVFLAIFIPGQTTLHLILASELGETAITNPEVIEIFELLKENLKNYISK